jgi:ATP-dependent DNA helicase RecQ
VGHDFRPDYLRLHTAVERLGNPTVLALTATASPPVRQEIVERLRLDDPVQVVRGFDRPNLHLEVQSFREDEQRREAVVLRAMGEAKPGLVYTATRKSAEQYAEALGELGIDAAAYHAGMRAADREDVHDRFTAGGLDVVVATTAFGMGIDKADVRFVLHAEVADSLDSYYQEIGRAGRDGEPAVARCTTGPRTSGCASSSPVARRTSPGCARSPRWCSTPTARWSPPRWPRRPTCRRPASPAGQPARAGRCRRGARQRRHRPVRRRPQPAAGRGRRAEVAESHRKVEQSRIEMMRAYAETTGCRRQFLLALLRGDARGARAGSATPARRVRRRSRPTRPTRRSRCSRR